MKQVWHKVADLLNEWSYTTENPIILFLGAMIQSIDQKVAMGYNMYQSNQDKQYNKGQAREADERQYKYSMALADHNAELAHDMWKKTNYSAQVDEAEKAGLNVGLLYGMGGGGGVTANAGSGGHGQGTAPRHESPRIDPNANGMAIMQAGLAQAQIENINADTEKKEAEAENLAGVQRENIETDTKLKVQEITNKQSQNTMQEMLNLEQGMSQEDRMSTINWMAKKAEAEARRSTAGAQVDEATVNANIERIEAVARQETLKNILIGEQTQLTKEQQEKVQMEIVKMNQEIKQNWQKLSYEQQRIELQKWVEEIKASYPGLFNVAGNIIDKGLRNLQTMMGSDTETGSHKYKK